MEKLTANEGLALVYIIGVLLAIIAWFVTRWIRGIETSASSASTQCKIQTAALSERVTEEVANRNDMMKAMEYRIMAEVNRIEERTLVMMGAHKDLAGKLDVHEANQRNMDTKLDEIANKQDRMFEQLTDVLIALGGRRINDRDRGGSL